MSRESPRMLTRAAALRISRSRIEVGMDSKSLGFEIHSSDMRGVRMYEKSTKSQPGSRGPTPRVGIYVERTPEVKTTATASFVWEFTCIVLFPTLLTRICGCELRGYYLPYSDVRGIGTIPPFLHWCNDAGTQVLNTAGRFPRPRGR